MPELKLELKDADTGEPVKLYELDRDTALAMLTAAEITAAELVPWGSNHTFAVALEHEGQQHLGIYKPTAGERPLHDFPFGTLHKRELASFVVSDALGWEIVPATVIRDGPYGEGSLQIFVPHEAEREDVEEFWGADTLENERIFMFDILTNNADRKITHCLVSEQGRVFGIDHGLTFHTQPKLRTALWQFCDQPIRPEIKHDLERFLGMEPALQAISGLLAADEYALFLARIRHMLGLKRYPLLDPRFNIPYGWW